MAKLIFRRLHQWPDIRQSYEIHLDGTPVASIGSGKTVEIEVAPVSTRSRRRWARS